MALAWTNASIDIL